MTAPNVPPRSIRIDRATASEARAIADVLTIGFDRGGLLEVLMRPFWHYALYDDVRNRLDGNPATYACWLATRDGAGAGSAAVRSGGSGSFAANPPNVPLGTVELSLRPFGTWNRDTWFWQVGRQHCPYIANLAVVPTARRRGIASGLLDCCERTARDWGYDRIYLHVLTTNDRAVRLYRQRGYRIQPSEAKTPLDWLTNPNQVLMCKVLGRSGDRRSGRP